MAVRHSVPREVIRREEIAMMDWSGNGMSGWGYALMGLSTVLFWGLLVVGIVALVRYSGLAQRGSPHASPTPEQILADRFARGEIDTDEYHRRIETLRTVTRPLSKS